LEEKKTTSKNKLLVKIIFADNGDLHRWPREKERKKEIEALEDQISLLEGRGGTLSV
jgi:hypothetical protein